MPYSKSIDRSSSEKFQGISHQRLIQIRCRNCKNKNIDEKVSDFIKLWKPLKVSLEIPFDSLINSARVVSNFYHPTKFNWKPDWVTSSVRWSSHWVSTFSSIRFMKNSPEIYCQSFNFVSAFFSLISLQKLFLFGASSEWEIILINMSSYIIAHLFHVRLSSSHSITLLYTDSFKSYEKYQRVAQKERFLRVCSRSPWIRKIMMWWNWC
jgi:hypothetical protein